jgi:hypothetical protein
LEITHFYRRELEMYINDEGYEYDEEQINNFAIKNGDCPDCGEKINNPKCCCYSELKS